MLNRILDQIYNNEILARQDLIYVLDLEDPDKLEQIYRAADQIRQKYVGEEIHLRGLIEFSNFCRKNCNYCGIRRDNKKLQRYRMEEEEILASVAEAVSLGYRTVVLQSGEDPYYNVSRLEQIIREIKQQFDIAITLSIGERPRNEYEQLYAAGADRFLMRFETSNPALYARLHPDSNFDQRMQCLRWLREIGYQVGSGIMIGLPGQTTADLANDILTFKDLDLDMVGVGPYICNEDTPLAGSPNGTVEMTFKVVALTRIMTHNAHIPATTALATLRPADGREKALQLGANVVMPNVSPIKYRTLYSLYPDKICISEGPHQCQGCINKRLSNIGRPVSSSYGNSLKQSWKHHSQAVNS